MPHRLIDLSHTIHDGMVTFKGLPAPHICDFWSRDYSSQFYAGGTSFQIGKIDMVANTGTYLDTPFHRFADGKDLAAIILEQLAGLQGVVVRVPYSRTLAIGPEYFSGLALEGKAVLVHTGWDAHWQTEAYYSNHPYLSGEAAEYLVKAGVALVGIDSHNIDNISRDTRPVHTTLLGNEVLILEHLCNLGALPDTGFTLTAVPPKVQGMGTFPVRAFATIDENGGNRKASLSVLTGIKMLLTDVDGVLTDAGMYYTEAGDELKKFNTRDGMGLTQLRAAGIKTGILTRENTQMVARRAQKLKIDHLFQGAWEKLPVLRQFCAESGIAISEIAYVGDDINDIEVLLAVGFAACPSDAATEVLAIPGIYRLNKPGGGGCIRELADMLLESRSA